MSQLESQVAEKKIAAKHEEIEKLEEHLEFSELHLSNLKEATAESWQEIKHLVEAAWARIKEAFKPLFEDH